MATRPRGFGMTAELAKKQAGKFDSNLATEALQWIKETLNGKSEDSKLLEALDKVPDSVETSKDVIAALKDGVVLAHLGKIVVPDSGIKQINYNKMAFKQMENINNFLKAADAMVVNKTDMFQTVDLYEGQNIAQVINGIGAFSRRAKTKGYVDVSIGPKESTANKREFTEEQLRAGEGIVGLQAGSNKGASQAGQNFGKTRAIID